VKFGNEFHEGRSRRPCWDALDGTLHTSSRRHT
jgi:hypothetical protein